MCLSVVLTRGGLSLPWTRCRWLQPHAFMLLGVNTTNQGETPGQIIYSLCPQIVDFDYIIFPLQNSSSIEIQLLAFSCVVTWQPLFRKVLLFSHISGSCRASLSGLFQKHRQEVCLQTLLLLPLVLLNNALLSDCLYLLNCPQRSDM